MLLQDKLRINKHKNFFICNYPKVHEKIPVCFVMTSHISVILFTCHLQCAGLDNFNVIVSVIFVPCKPALFVEDSFFFSFQNLWGVADVQVYFVVYNSDMSLMLCCSHEAMSDLIALMASLVDVKGNILVPGVNDAVKPLSEEEKALYDPIDFDKVN